MVFFNKFRHLKRYNEIIMIFAKYGFDALINQLGILEYLNIKKKIVTNTSNEVLNLSTGERLRLALEELGPTFVKLGQIISTRSDLLSEDIISELEKLHDAVPAISFEEVKSRIEIELGEDLEDIFLEFNKKPLAAASIGQVHLAKLKDGQQVVVKIQRPGIERKIEDDIEILKDLSWFIDNHTKYGQLYNFTDMIKEFEITLKNELNFKVEGRNTEKAKENCSKNKNVIVPTVYWDYTTRCILTLEYIKGISLSNYEALEKENIDHKQIARIIAKSITEQILEDGFYHGDPHPGNIMALPNNKIAFIDFGMVGKLNEERKGQFLKILSGVAFKNSKPIVEAITSLDTGIKRSDIKKLENDVDYLMDMYLELPLNEINLAEIFNEVFNLAFKYNIKIPKEFTMLTKALGTIEGVVAKLDPELNVLEIAEPIAKKFMFKTFSPQTIKKDMLESMSGYGELMKNFPNIILNFFKNIEDEDYTLNFELKSTDKILNRFDKITNKVSFNIALLSLSIIIAGLIVGFGMAASVSTEVYQVSFYILKFGLIAAVLMYVWLIFSIFKTGRF